MIANGEESSKTFLRFNKTSEGNSTTVVSKVDELDEDEEEGESELISVFSSNRFCASTF